MIRKTSFVSLSLFVAAMMVVSLATAAAQTSPLEKLPYSGAVLMQRAISAGRVIPNQGLGYHNPFALTCSPAPCIVPETQASEGGNNPVNEDPITANPLNSKQLITGGNDYNCSSLQGFFATSDGGTTWTRNCLAVESGKSGAGDPIVGYDRLGNVFVGGIDLTGSTSVIAVSKSTNAGVTFGAPFTAGVNLIGGVVDKPWMEIDTNPTSAFVNSIYISTTQFATNNDSEIGFSYSRDQGATWKTLAVDTRQTYPNIDQFSDLAVGRDGTVYLSWMRCSATGTTGDCGGTVATMVFSKSTDGGVTWSTPITMASITLAPDSCGAFYGCLPNTSERLSNVPAIAVDASGLARNGTLYSIMYNYAGTQLSVQVVHSTNGGNTWSAPVKVAPAVQTHDQFFPWVNVASRGQVAVTWFDRRNDPANKKYQPFVAVSLNGGASFTTNTPETAILSDTTKDGFGGAFMGDYSTNIWAGTTLYHSWMDMRTNVSQDEVGGIRAH